MGLTPFQFKHFSLLHGPGLKVTTDAVFFGAWAPLEGEGPVLDIGAGTGLLSLMAAQRRPGAHPIHALEPNAEALSVCRQNFTQSPWAQRLTAYGVAIEDFHPTLLYHDILCNPPFFVDALPSQDEALSQALHADRQLLARWLSLAIPMLAPSGRLHLMVQPATRMEVLKLACKLGLDLMQEGFLHHSPGHAALRWLCTLARIEAPVVRRPNWFVKDENGETDTAYREIVKAFYLKM